MANDKDRRPTSRSEKGLRYFGCVVVVVLVIFGLLSISFFRETCKDAWERIRQGDTTLVSIKYGYARYEWHKSSVGRPQRHERVILPVKVCNRSIWKHIPPFYVDAELRDASGELVASESEYISGLGPLKFRELEITMRTPDEPWAKWVVSLHPAETTD